MRISIVLMALMFIVAATEISRAESPKAESISKNPLKSFVVNGRQMKVRVGELEVSQSDFGIFVMPSETLEISAVGHPDQFLLRATRGSLRASSSRSESGLVTNWEWIAPENHGYNPISILRLADGQEIQLNVFVMVPNSEVLLGKLNGYDIGQYPASPLNGHDIYLPPQGFVEVTEKNRQVLLSENFALGEFVSKQAGDFPKYVVLKERLMLMLEAMVGELESVGIPADSVHIMSGFRTPFYNRSIGNTAYSLHQWGMAADILIDGDPSDAVMDDLDGDGEITIADARLIFEIAKRLQAIGDEKALVGGAGLYGPDFPRRGPFIHIDARGWKANW